MTIASNPPGPRLPRGARFGHYEIVSALGIGGMGEVYRARDPRLARDVALKIVAFDAAARPERARRFEQEARAAAALNHPNVLSIYDAGTEAGTPYVVFELLDGETLRARLVRDPVPLRKALKWSIQIARGLGAAHERRIIHRDLKPENVFLTRDERVKILDFGLAKLTACDDKDAADGESTISGDTDPGLVLGTAGYMSPEQARGLTADARSDIFALGAVIYELLSGRRAFHRDTAAETLTAILREEPPELTAPQGPVPPALDRIVRRCLEKDPAHRFRAAHDLAFALEALSESLSPLGGASVASPARRPWTRLALATLALAASGGAFFYAGHKTAERRVPSFQRLTFRRGAVMSARYAPDGRTVVYAASWDGDPRLRLFSTRVERPESTRLDLPAAGLLGLSASGELALALDQPFAPAGRVRRFSRHWTGTLARVPLAGGAPRSVLDGVSAADWADADGLAVVRSRPWRARLEFPIGDTRFEDAEISNPRVSPDGSRVAFVRTHNPAVPGASVAVIDRAGTKTDLSDGWRSVTGLAWAPRGHEVWFTATKGAAWTQELHAVTLTGRQRLLLRNPAWIVLQDIGPDGRVLLTSGTLRVQTACLAPGWTRERDMSWLESFMIEDLSADGRTLLVSDHGASGGPHGALYLLDTTETSEPPTRLGDAFLGAALSPDGRAATVRGSEHIVLLPTGAGEPRRFETPGVTPLGIRWFRDGRRCLVLGMEAPSQPRTYVLHVEEGTLEALPLEGRICSSQSPDGRELLCLDAESRRWTIYSLERRESRPAPGLEADERILDWATDGAVYVRSQGPGPEIHRLDLRTGQRTLWRRLANSDPACLLSDGFNDVFVAPQAGAYCYTTWCNLLDLYQVTGLE